MLLPDYLDMRISQASEVGIEVKLLPQRYVIESNAKWTGLFDAEEKSVELARKSPYFWPVMIHEFCHMDQWIEKTPEEQAYNKCKLLERFDDFFQGKTNFTLEQQLIAMNVMRALEFDCEKRVVNQITTYDLPIDIPTYIQQANAYMYYHAVMFMLRRLHVKKSPSRHKAIYSTMPTEFLTEKEYDNPPVEFVLRCLKYCY